MNDFFVQVKAPVMHYLWGEQAHPYIAELLSQEGGNQPWAELWLGTHPSGCDMLWDETMSLQQYIDEDKIGRLGGELASEVGTLPFLLKVLCCSSPLSIQTHPDKITAQRLHREMPGEFPDANHKPEVIWAISEFQLMAGFRPLEAILSDLNSLTLLAPWKRAVSNQPSLKEICQFILRTDKQTLRQMEQQLSLLPSETSEQVRFCQFLSSQYPGDPGVFFGFLLNHFTLSPGEAVFVNANIAHAYVCGRGIECMANSNNVIRAGLTAKRVDKELLLETLNFESVAPEQLKIAGGQKVDFSCGQDFRLRISKECREDFMTTPGKPAILLVLEGSALLECCGFQQKASRGSAWFIPAGMPLGKAIPGEHTTLVCAEGVEI